MMKNIVRAALVAILSVSVHAGVPEIPDTPDLRCFEPGDTLPIGPRAEAHALAYMRYVTVEVWDESNRDRWTTERDFPNGVNSTNDIAAYINTLEPTLGGVSPLDEVRYQVQVRDRHDEVLFESFSSVRWTKRYRSDGSYYYTLPEEVSLYFYLAAVPIEFCEEIEGAMFTYAGWRSELNEWEVDFDDNVLYLPGWMASHHDGTLLVDLEHLGVSTWGSVTGQPTQRLSFETGLDASQFGNIQPRDLIGLEMGLQVNADYGDSPVFEITSNDDGVAEFHIRSNHGHTPIAIWVNTLSNIRAGGDWLIVQPDDDGEFELEVEDSVPFLIWAEWPWWVGHDGKG